jgi:glyoxylase-like metal-dependent hydrolase (beta-lactamase superfamily II)
MTDRSGERKIMYIAERWFERKTLSDGITLLWEPHVHPLLRCNIWHVRGRDKDLLVDTGLGAASLGDEIADLIDKPLIAVATHVHYDHVGSLHEFDERLIHRDEAQQMASYAEFSSLRCADFPSGFLDSFEGPENFDEYLINALPRADFRIDEFAITSSQPTRTVTEGDGVDLGNRHFEVLHLPGHSPGSIGLLDVKAQTLFSGDAVYDGLLLDDLPDSNITDYLTTMRRLQTLQVRVVHGGHEPSFDGARLVELADAYIASRS